MMTPEQAAKKLILMKLVDEFKDFVSDSFDEGLGDDFDDLTIFMGACMGVFLEMKQDEVAGG